MVSTNNRVPPGPRGLPLVGVSLRLLRDPLSLLASVAHNYGDIARIPLTFDSRIFINHPNLIEQVLVLQQHNFHKGALIKKATGRLLGQGLLTSEGEFWRRQRRLAQPAFHHSRIESYASTMVEQALARLKSWREGDARDLCEEMMQITLGVAVRTLLGTELDAEGKRVGEAVGTLMRYQLRRLRSPVRLPENWPTRGSRRANQAYEYLDSIVYRIIEDRRARQEQGHDLLSLLISAADDDGSRMTPQQLRDETMTIFLAGHETTALTLAWTWYLLAENARTEVLLHEELGRVLSGRSPRVEDLDRLPYLEAIVHESLRLYPPAYAMARTSIEPFDLGGYRFPAGTTVLMSQWVMHRDPRYFQDPRVFRPERWLDGLATRLPSYAYFPFGGGPRRCIGQGFAEMEAMLLLATIAQRYRFRLVPDHPVAPDPLVTLRARHGIPMTLHTRS
jgi:cytochrome P450